MSDDWHLYVGSEYEILFKTTDSVKRKEILERIEANLPVWLEKRKDVIKEHEEWGIADKEEELRQAEEGVKITEHEAITLLVGRVILKAIGDLRMKTDKIPKQEPKSRAQYLSDKRALTHNQKDGFRFIFEDDHLERFLAFWNYEVDVKFLRRKILETFNMSNMQETQSTSNINIMALENIGKKRC